MSTLTVFLPEYVPPTFISMQSSSPIDHIRRLRAAIELVGYHHEDRDGHLRVVPNAAIRVEAIGFGHGVLISITLDSWIEIQLDGEERRDEYLPCQVQLETVGS